MRSLRYLALGAAFALATAAAPASAEHLAGAGPQPSTIRVGLSGGGASQALTLPRGKSAIIELPVDARDVLVTNPQVADAVLRSPRRIYVLGVASGQTDAVFFDAAGRRILSLDIRVDQDTGAVAQTINRLLPGARVRIDAMNDSLILSGEVMSLADADKAVRIATAAVARPEQVLNMLSIAGKDQVMLKVRIVEVQRNVIKQLGFSSDALTNDGDNAYGFARSSSYGVNGVRPGGADLCFGQNNLRQTNHTNNTQTSTNLNNGSLAGTNQQTTVTTAIPGGQTTVTTTDNSNSGLTVASALTNAASTIYSTATGGVLNTCLQAFERVGLVRTLAEPNLTAVSGEAAQFLAGGEFPVPVGQDDTGRITIEFKPFGVGLGFTPVVLSGGRISLKISTEVSELTNDGAFSVGNGENAPSLVIPALSVRRAQTMVELPSGGAMMIAGLLREQTRQTVDSLPGMTNLPVLGSLFRSRDFLKGETELVIIVTPYLVKPTSPDQLQTPADGLKIASDPETVLLGRLNRAYRAEAPTPGAPAYQGPYGYVIE